MAGLRRSSKSSKYFDRPIMSTSRGQEPPTPTVNSVGEALLPPPEAPDGLQETLRGQPVVLLHGLTMEEDYWSAKSKSRHVTSPGTAEAGFQPWSRAWGRNSSESAWWPGCSSRDPAGPSPNERREAIPQWAHHMQGEPRRTSPKRIGRRTKEETSAVQSPDA
ncbi:hypothetical protein ILYODFUR_010345 [Ilyodon furcidens]|uniref:Uncharacterized protein n=1 Tax=Ilyodon furcidens TaxID=33524 RepID=A0ABV0U478_9TELE